MTNILQGPRPESSRIGSVFALCVAISTLAGLTGWGIRGNQVLDEMKEDPIGWVSRLPLHKQAELKIYLRNVPEELADEPVSPPHEPVSHDKNAQ